MARPRENGGSQEASPPVQPSGGHPGASCRLWQPGAVFLFYKKEREGNGSECWPGSQNPGRGGKMETAAHQRARALLEQICADSGGRRSLRRWVFQWRQPRPLQPFRPQLARGECSKIPGLAIQGLAQLTSLLIRAWVSDSRSPGPTWTLRASESFGWDDSDRSLALVLAVSIAKSTEKHPLQGATRPHLDLPAAREASPCLLQVSCPQRFLDEQVLKQYLSLG